MKDCKKCKAWSFGGRRCQIGKVNPDNLRDAKRAFMRGGSGYLCKHNPWINGVKNEEDIDSSTITNPADNGRE